MLLTKARAFGSFCCPRALHAGRQFQCRGHAMRFGPDAGVRRAPAACGANRGGALTLLGAAACRRQARSRSSLRSLIAACYHLAHRTGRGRMASGYHVRVSRRLTGELRPEYGVVTKSRTGAPDCRSGSTCASRHLAPIQRAGCIVESCRRDRGTTGAGNRCPRSTARAPLR
jgi:hypothetical protein